MQTLQILYFGALKEQAQHHSITENFPISLAQLKQSLNQYEPSIDFNSKQVICAVNQTICHQDDISITTNDEVAFFPPTTGG